MILLRVMIYFLIFFLCSYVTVDASEINEANNTGISADIELPSTNDAINIAKISSAQNHAAVASQTQSHVAMSVEPVAFTSQVPVAQVIPAGHEVNSLQVLDSNDELVNDSTVNSSQLQSNQFIEQQTVQIPQTFYMVVDPNKIQVYANAGQKKNITTNLQNYVEELAAVFFNVARVVPEILPIYVIEFISKNAPILVKGVNQKILSPFDVATDNTYNWALPQSGNIGLGNLYQGLVFLQDLYNSSFLMYDLNFRSANMDQPMSNYFKALRDRYPHVPDTILMSYITIFLKDSSSANKSFDQLMQGINSPQLSKTIAGYLDIKKLTDLQKLYLMMDALEKIHTGYDWSVKTTIDDHASTLRNQMMVSNEAQAIAMKSAIESSGIVNRILSAYGVAQKNLKNLTVQAIPDISSLNFEKFKQNYLYQVQLVSGENSTILEQFEVVYIKLNQDIIALKQKIEGITGQKQVDNDLKKKLQDIIHQAEQLSNEMNNQIIQQVVSGSVEQSTTHQNISLAQQELHQFSMTDQQNLPIAQLIRNQSQQILDQILTWIQKIKNIAILLEAGQNIDFNKNQIILNDYDISSINFLTIDAVKAAQLKIQKLLQHSQEDQNTQNFVITYRQVAIKLANDLQILENYQKSVNAKTADEIVALYNNPVTQNKDATSYKAAVIAALEQLKVQNNSGDVQQILDDWNNPENEKSPLDGLNALIGKIVFTDLQSFKVQSEKYEVCKDVITQLIKDYKILTTEQQQERVMKSRIDQYVTNFVERDAYQYKAIPTLIEIIQNEITRLQQFIINKEGMNASEEVATLNKMLAEEKKDKNGKVVIGDIPQSIEKFTVQDIPDVQALIEIYNNIALKLQALELEKVLDSFFMTVSLPNVAERSVQIDNALTEVVWSRTGPVWNWIKGHPVSSTILGVAVSYITIASSTIISIQSDQSLTAAEKKKRQKQVILACLYDIANHLISVVTGAKKEVVATGNLQAIGMDAALNQTITILDPDAVYTYDSSVNSSDYVTNLSKFQAQYDNKYNKIVTD